MADQLPVRDGRGDRRQIVFDTQDKVSIMKTRTGRAFIRLEPVVQDFLSASDPTPQCRAGMV